MKKLITDLLLKRKIQNARREGISQNHIACGYSLFLVVNKTSCRWRVLFKNYQRKTVSYTLGYYPNVSLYKAREKTHLIKHELKYSKSAKYLFKDAVSEFLNTKSLPRQKSLKTQFKKFSAIGWDEKDLNRLSCDDFQKYVKIVKGISQSDCAIHLSLRALRDLIVYSNVVGKVDDRVSNQFTNLLKLYPKPHSDGFKWKKLDELKEYFFKPMSDENYLIRAFCLFIASTALRVKSASNLKWSWIDFENSKITIPKEYMKNKRIFVIPITPLLSNLLKNLEKRYKGGSDYVFVAPNTQKPFATNYFQRSVTKNCKGELSLHGFRKTIATWLGENSNKYKFSYFITDVILSHVDKKGVSNTDSTYNHSDYYDDKFKAYKYWQSALVHELPSEFKELLEINQDM